MSAPSTEVSVIDRLVAAGCVAAAEEGAALLAAAPDEATLEAWLRRREQGEPLAWIIGTLRFCGRQLHVEPGLYVPRPHPPRSWPAVPPGCSRTTAGPSPDLCTGTGAVAAHLRVLGPLPQRSWASMSIDGPPPALGATAYPRRWPTLLGHCARGEPRPRDRLVAPRPDRRAPAAPRRRAASRTSPRPRRRCRWHRPRGSGGGCGRAGSFAPAVGCSSRSAGTRTRRSPRP